MSYSDLLKPRKDVLSEDGIEGIIDLEDLKNKRKLEARPAEFLSLTYPTADTRRVIETLHRRFGGDTDAPGVFLFEGLKGSGKSHLLLMVYHLFKSRAEGQKWLIGHGLDCSVPEDAVVVLNKLTDLPVLSLWDFVFEQLTGKRPANKQTQPGLEEVKTALGDRRLVLILDELEQGIRVIRDPSVQAQNIAFLQMLSEWSNREDRVTLFASIYSDREEPGSTLLRGPACRVRLEHSGEKARIVLHRLFANYSEAGRDAGRPTVDSYLAAWKRHAAIQKDDFESRFLESFPFHPDLLQIVLERVPVRGGFQNVRGALGFLSRLVRLTHGKTDLISPGHADLADQEVMVRLSDLDPSNDLTRRARENLRDLRDYPLVGTLGATTMLYTLSGAGRDRGATREELLRAVVAPDTDINDFERTLLALQRYASYFHIQEGRYYFDQDENPDAKVEFRSLMVPEDRARSLVLDVWRDDLFGEAVFLEDVEATKEKLGELEKGRLRFVVSPRRLKPEERRQLYSGLDERNQVILLEPKDSGFSALRNRDLIKWAQRSIAARELQPSQDASRRDTYQRIERQDRGHIADALRRAGLLYVRVEKYGENPSQDAFEEESLGNNVKREDVVERLSQDFHPPQLLAEHIVRRLLELRNVTVRDVDADYRKILGFPVPTHVDSVMKAVRLLCREGQVGVRHSQGDFCEQDPPLNWRIWRRSPSSPLRTGRAVATSELRTRCPPGAGYPWKRAPKRRCLHCSIDDMISLAPEEAPTRPGTGYRRTRQLWPSGSRISGQGKRAYWQFGL